MLLQDPCSCAINVNRGVAFGRFLTDGQATPDLRRKTLLDYDAVALVLGTKIRMLKPVLRASFKGAAVAVLWQECTSSRWQALVNSQ